jgi:hypothetical protein
VGRDDYFTGALTTTYAGFSGESLLLEDLHKRGMALPDEVGPSLRAGDGMLFARHTTPVAPWQDERWLNEMRRSLRPSAYAQSPARLPVTDDQTGSRVRNCSRST